jgi:hypothetical protein
MLVAVQCAVAALGLGTDAVSIVEGAQISDETVAIQRGSIRIGVTGPGPPVHIFCRIVLEESAQAAITRLTQGQWSKLSAALEESVREGRTFGYLEVSRAGVNETSERWW